MPRLCSVTRLFCNAFGLYLIAAWAVASVVFAGIGGSVVPSFPTPLKVGDIKTATITITNRATAPNNTETVNVSGIYITPSCQVSDGFTCQTPDIGVFQFATAIGKSNTSCASVVFTIGAVNPATGEFQLTPQSLVTLGPADGSGPLPIQCVININFQVLRAPLDSSPPNPPLTTDGLGRATLQGSTSGATGSGSGGHQTAIASSGVDLVIGTTDGKSTVAPGSSQVYTLVVANNGATGVSNATVVDTAPTGVTFGSWTCTVTSAGTGGSSATACGAASGSGNLNTTATFRSGGVVTYTINATITAGSGSVTNTASVSPPSGTSNTGTSCVTNGNPPITRSFTNPTCSSSDVSTVSQGSDLVIATTDGVTTVNAGGSTTYTVTVTNNGPTEMTGATVVDTAPAGVTFGSWTCSVINAGSGGSVTTACGAASGSGNVNTTANLKAAGVVRYTINASITAGSGTVINTASVTPPAGVGNTGASCITGGGITRSFANPTCGSSDSDNVQPVADLVIAKTDGVASVNAGGSTTYTVTVTNNGPSELTGAVVADSAPSGVSIGAWSCAVINAGSGGSVTTACGAASGSGNLNSTASLKVGGVVRYTINAMITAGSGTVSNTASVTPSAGTGNSGISCVSGGGITRTYVNPTCNSSDADTVQPVVDLVISKTDGVSTVNAGGATTYTLTVANNGPSEVIGAAVVDTAPVGITLGNWTCAVTNAGGGGTVTTACGTASGTGNLNTTANLKVGGTVTYSIAATITPGSGTVTNTASVTPPGGTSNSGTSCVSGGGMTRSFANPTCSSSDADTVQPVGPAISAVSPTVSQSVLGGSISFIVTATDSLGVTSVSLWNGSTQLASASVTGSGPYVLTWSPIAAGTFSSLTIKATNGGGTTSSYATPISAIVTAPPGSATPAADASSGETLTTATVGTVAGAFSVTEQGGVSYSVPIQLPPGTGGLQPSLSLNYNSQSGADGHLGIGWSLGGLSAITRCAETPAQDTSLYARRAINYDNNADNDKYCLDGQRLVPIGGAITNPTLISALGITSNETGYEYRTELHSFARIVAIKQTDASTILGPWRFVVQTRNGQTLQFGSRWWILSHGHDQVTFDPARTNTVKIWVLDRVSDIAGNYWRVDYAALPSQNIACSFSCPAGPMSPNGPIGNFPEVEYWPQQVSYFAQDNTPVGKVDFTYSVRPLASGVGDHRRLYDSGAGAATLTKQLDSITVSTYDTGGALAVRKYSLIYETSATSGRRRLTQVNECLSNGTTCLGPTQFAWQDTAAAFGVQGADLVPQTPLEIAPTEILQRIKTGDVDGDGITDLVRHTPPDQGDQNIFELCRGTSAGIASCTTWYIWNNNHPFPAWQLADMDGDGKADLILMTGLNSSPSIVCYSNGTTSLNEGNCRSIQIAGEQHWTKFGDFNGDGKIDVLVYQGNYVWDVCLGKPRPSPGNPGCTQHAALSLTINDADGSTQSNHVIVGDFNGDGKTDFMLRRRAHVQGTGDTCTPDPVLTQVCQEMQWRTCVADFTNAPAAGPPMFACHANWVLGLHGDYQDAVVADFNGDGLADVAERVTQNDIQVTAASYACPAGTTGSDPSCWRVCTTVGDGAFQFTDPGIHFGYYDSNNNPVWLDSTGAVINNNPSSPSSIWNVPRCRYWTGPKKSFDAVLLGDFNGDGRTDILSKTTQESSTLNVCVSQGTESFYDQSAGNWVRSGKGFDCLEWPMTVGSGASAGDYHDFRFLRGGDFNGDGVTDVVFTHGQNWSRALTGGSVSGQITVPTRGDLLRQVTNGLGATNSVTYAPLTDSSVYTKGTGADSALNEINIQSPLYVVKQTLASNGNLPNVDVRADFTYADLRGTTHGRGLLGFGTKTQIDFADQLASKITTVTKFHNTLSDWQRAGRPFQQTKTESNGNMFSKMDTSWTSRAATVNGSGQSAIWDVFADTVTASQWDVNRAGNTVTALPTTTTTSSFDTFGNLTQNSVTTSETGVGNYTKTTSNTYLAPDTNYWIVDRLASAQTVSLIPAVVANNGTTSLTRTATFGYNGYGATCGPAPAGRNYRGLLCIETLEPASIGTASCAANDDLCQRTEYVYDAYGNRTSVAVSAPNVSARTTTTQFNSYGHRFPTQISNALSQTETLTYDARFGEVTQRVGPNQLLTETLFDGFGRKQRESAYDSNTTSGHRMADSAWVYLPCAANDPVYGAATACASGEAYRVRTRVAGQPTRIVYYDKLQRERRSLTQAFASGAWAASVVSYDVLGRKATTTAPAGSGNATATLSYDQLGRAYQEQTVGGSLSQKNVTTTTGLSTTVSRYTSDTTSQDTTKVVWGNGQARSVTDAAGGLTSYFYDPAGNLIRAAAPGSYVEVFGYDRRGRKTSLISPDAGNWTYVYNGLGELTRQAVDTTNQVTQLFYDNLGRMTERREYPGDVGAANPFVTNWSYDQYANGAACSKGIGKLCEVRTGAVINNPLANSATVQRTTYDSAGRSASTAFSLDSRTFVNAVAYDTLSRVQSQTFPSGFTVNHAYTSWSGQPNTLFSGSTTWWNATARNLDGGLTGVTLGQIGGGFAGVGTSKAYDGFGRIQSITTTKTSQGDIQAATYGFDLIGNLTSRGDPVNGLSAETIGYDALNRLTTRNAATIAGYDAAGNPISRQDLNTGTWTYLNYTSGSHRLCVSSTTSNPSCNPGQYGYDVRGNATTFGTRTLGYTPFNLPQQIAGNGNTLSYTYDHNHGRVKEVSTGPGGRGTTYLLGGYEEHIAPNGVVEERHYLPTAEGVIGTFTLRGDGSSDARYWHKDQVASVVTITDASGTVKERIKYDPWGGRATVASSDPYLEERGFTGHEHLDEVGLIHMNGRIYDPVVGRFLQADPLLQAPLNSQSFNRYSYVLNNPLAFTDPSGFSWWTKWRGTVIGLAVAVASYGAFSEYFYAQAIAAGASTEAAAVIAAQSATVASGTAGGFAAGGIQGGNLESALFGAFQGGLFAGLNFGIGEITAHTPIFNTGRYYGNIALHAALGCAQASAAGGRCGAGAVAGGFSAAASPLNTGVVARAAIGAVASRLAGGRAQDGAMIAAFDYLFNELGNPQQRGYEPTFYDGGTVCNAGSGGCASWSGAVEATYPELIIGGIGGTIRGVYGGVRGALGLGDAAAFFEGTTLHPRVLGQLRSGDWHAFPSSVDAFAATSGTARQVLDSRGKMVEMLTVRGGYRGSTGTFEYIKNSANQIYHRFFRAD